LGIEDAFSDAFCQGVIDRHVLPAFKAGKLDHGIIEGAKALVDRMKLYPTIPANDNEALSAKEAA
jgi:uncharacterized membrane protein YgcG